MTHKCPRRGCTAQLPASLLMCKADWYKVPAPLRDAVNRAYARGRGLGTEALRHAQAAAIRAVNREEGEPG